MEGDARKVMRDTVEISGVRVFLPPAALTIPGIFATHIEITQCNGIICPTSSAELALLQTHHARRLAAWSSRIGSVCPCGRTNPIDLLVWRGVDSLAAASPGGSTCKSGSHLRVGGHFEEYGVGGKRDNGYPQQANVSRIVRDDQGSTDVRNG